MQISADEMQHCSNIYEICFLTFSLFYECSDFNKIFFGIGYIAGSLTPRLSCRRHYRLCAFRNNFLKGLVNGGIVFNAHRDKSEP